ncbi:MAG: phage protease, partial [Candidatus Oleimicrobiaceae bacterium]
INQGNVDRSSGWEFTAEDSNRLLGDPPDWDAYALWFLGIREEENPETKARFAYPYGKNGKVYRSAVIAAKQRAAQQQHLPISRAADELLTMIDGEQAARARTVELSAQDIQGVTQWVQLLPLGHVRTVDGRQFVFDAEDGAKVLAVFQARVGDLPVTVEHVSFAGAVGWVRSLELRLPRDGEEAGPDHGLWALVEWTARGFELLRDRAFRAMSPELLLDRRNPPHVVELVGASLVTAPAIDGMALVAKREKGEVMAELNEHETRTQLEEELQMLRAALDQAQDEIGRLKEELQAERLQRKMAELKASRLITEELERLAVDIFRAGGEELFTRWAETLPQRKAPPTGRIGEPEQEKAEVVEFAETFPGERALLAKAKKLSREKGISLAEALSRITEGGAQ